MRQKNAREQITRCIMMSRIVPHQLSALENKEGVNLRQQVQVLLGSFGGEAQRSTRPKSQGIATNADRWSSPRPQHVAYQ